MNAGAAALERYPVLGALPVSTREELVRAARRVREIVSRLLRGFEE